MQNQPVKSRKLTIGQFHTSCIQWDIDNKASLTLKFTKGLLNLWERILCHHCLWQYSQVLTCIYTPGKVVKLNVSQLLNLHVTLVSTPHSRMRAIARIQCSLYGPTLQVDKGLKTRPEKCNTRPQDNYRRWAETWEAIYMSTDCKLRG
jgi:hypothetical protein